MTSRAALYCRVSSNQQEEDGTSLSTQEERCRAFAEARGYDVTGVYRDTHTGVQYRERPGLGQMREILRAGGIDIVVIYAIDRLSRHQAHLAIIAEEIDDHGARLEFVTEDFEDSAVGRFIRSARAFAAEIEHEKIRERTTRGKIERVKSGRLLASTKPLYGYQWRDDSHGQLDIDLMTAPIVERIYSNYASGMSIRSISAALIADGVPTPTGKSHRWQYTTIRGILLNPSYKGEAHGWGLQRASPGESQRFDPSRAIALPKGTIPQIVDAATWNGVQAMLQRNKLRAVRNAREPEAALLRGGFVRCGYCGWTMTARPRSDGQYDYICGSSRLPERICPRPTISCRKLDKDLWGAVREAMLHPNAIALEMERLRADDPTERDLELLDRSLAEIERQRDNLARALAMADDSEITSSLMSQLRTLGERRQQLMGERSAAAIQRESWEASQGQLAGLEEWREQVASNIDELDYTQKRLLLDLLKVQIKVWKADHTPRYKIGGVINLAIVSSTTSRTDHNVLLSWTDQDVEKAILPRWSRTHDACIACRGTDRPYKARGMCDRCYRRWWREQRTSSP